MFEGIKNAVTKEPVLTPPDFSKNFEVYTDSSHFSIGGVLIEGRYPITFQSPKLNEPK